MKAKDVSIFLAVLLAFSLVGNVWQWRMNQEAGRLVKKLNQEAAQYNKELNQVVTELEQQIKEHRDFVKKIEDKLDKALQAP